MNSPAITTTYLMKNIPTTTRIEATIVVANVLNLGTARRRKGTILPRRFSTTRKRKLNFPRRSRWAAA